VEFRNLSVLIPETVAFLLLFFVVTRPAAIIAAINARTIDTERCVRFDRAASMT
jgi:hypothetical protein